MRKIQIDYIGLKMERINLKNHSLKLYFYSLNLKRTIVVVFS